MFGPRFVYTGKHNYQPTNQPINQPTKELTKGGEVDVPLSSHSCVLTYRWALKHTPYSITGIRLH
jgi:hypothetical protein